MNTNKDLINSLYRKFRGVSFADDIVCDTDGSILVPSNRIMQKRLIARAVEKGCAAQLIDRMIVDPVQIGRMGTKRIRDGLGHLARSQQEDGTQLAKSFSALLLSSTASASENSGQREPGL